MGTKRNSQHVPEVDFKRARVDDFEGDTVVLVGDVGMGKSRIVEAVTGIQNLSSNSALSFTREALAVKTKSRILQIIDTPGGNALADKVEHNMHIALALSQHPVSMILVVVKADTRIDNTVGKVRELAERLLDFSSHLCACVTHMDTVTWEESAFQAHLEDELGGQSCIFVGESTPGAKIFSDILGHCKRPPLDVRITSGNFLKYFKVHKSNLKITRSVNDEVAKVKESMEVFYETMQQRRRLTDDERRDLAFEFQAYMQDEIIKAKVRVSKANDFNMFPTVSELGHLADMTNQMKKILLDVRTITLGYQDKAGVSELRKCPHCGLIWAKIAGCNGTTTCGNRLNEIDGHGSLSTFNFRWADDTFIIQKGEAKRVSQSESRGNIGCGKSITWNECAPVRVPPEFLLECGSANVDDVQDVDPAHQIPLKIELHNKMPNITMKTVDAP